MGPDTSIEGGGAASGNESMFVSPQRLQMIARGRSSQPQCTICNMKFSNRANARRHERNIHGKNLTSATMLMLKHKNQISISAPMRPQQNRPIVRIGGGGRITKHKPLPKIAFDYTKPELYRELLTDSKVYFIKRHIDFLEQYQNMRCTCCNRDFPTYKFFMAHMRKKYDTLSRNLCFKCLKQFETKSLFIGHLKKKNCINLYKVYCADDTISKEPLPPAPGSIRTGAKEIIANKVYGCKLCDKTFRLKVDFRGHVFESHAEEQKKEQIGPTCGFCKVEFEDPVIRRRHYNTMECIVFLICGTCDSKFDTLAQYIEHVHAEHLQHTVVVPVPIKTEVPDLVVGDDESDTTMPPLRWDDINSSGELDGNTTRMRNPQNCRVCGKQYNNYYNVLRHMESKHPDKLPRTYRCEQCGVGYPRQVELRDHMSKVHGVVMPKIRREMFTCRECGAVFDLKEVWLDHQATNHSKYFCHLCEMDTENIEELEAHLVEHSKIKTFKCHLCQHSFNSERGLETHLAVMHYMKKEQQITKSRISVQSSDNGDYKAYEDGNMGSVGGNDSEMNAADEDDDEYDGADYEGAGADVSGALEVHMNGGDDDDFEGDDGIDADLDDTPEVPIAKRPKLEMPPLVPVRQATSTPKSTSIVGAHSIRKCPLCHETFSGGIALANHLRTHGIPSMRQFMPKQPRPILPRPATSVRPVNSIGRPHVTSRMRCRICQKRIHTKASYKRHMLNVHQVRDCVFIRCTLCPAEFSNDKGLKVHMFRTHKISVQQMQEDERLRPVPRKESTSAGPSEVSKVTSAVNLLPKPKVMYECDICHTVYRSTEQLKAHRSVVHGASTEETKPMKAETAGSDNEEITEPVLTVPEAWWQCRYCDENFNASKKLTIHMNSHEEHDTTDHSCTDCGNVYRSRKSLWVHRHKKHPRLPNPSSCELCDKVFFDKTELFVHLKTHSNADVFTHLTEMQSQLAEEQEKQKKNNAGAAADVENLSCHVCGQKFHDKRVLSKHLRLHEHTEPEGIEALHPLASFLSDQVPNEGEPDYKYPSYQGQMVDGEYACDMCPKTFPLMNALKVHRGWHFRSPDGRQVTDPENMWQPESMAPLSSKSKRARLLNPPVCPYCNSTFASGNNLRRHIVEVHKRNEARQMRENGTVSDSVYVEKELECHTCDIKFNSRPEWVDHKISHARTMKPSTTFEWGCEICGKVFTRKERLLAHMIIHLSKDDPDATAGDEISEMAGESNSRSSISSQSQSQQSQESGKLKAALLKKQPALPREHPGTADSPAIKMEESEYEDDGNEGHDEEVYEDEDDDQVAEEEEQQQESDDEDEEDQDDHQEEVVEDGVVEHENDNEAEVEEEEPVAAYSCDLCQVFFRTAKELRRHVTSHIINGPEITITTSKPKEIEPVTANRELDGFKCRLCGSSSESHIGMIQCMDGHKVVSGLQCDQCHLYFADEQKMEDHEELCHPIDYEA